MIIMEHEDVSDGGRVRLAQQAKPGVPGSPRRRHWLWLEGLGLELAMSAHTGEVWGPEWLDVLEDRCELRGNALLTAVARAVRDPDWAQAAVTACALHGPKAVHRLLKHEEPAQ